MTVCYAQFFTKKILIHGFNKKKNMQHLLDFESILCFKREGLKGIYFFLFLLTGITKYRKT